MKRVWIYFINTFLVNTADSFKKMLKIGNDHDSRLAAEVSDPVVDAMYDVFHPGMLLYRTLYTNWTSSGELKKGKTASFTKLLRDLSKIWIWAWEGQVFSHFPENSPEAAIIFPYKKAPFNSEDYEVRIEAVQSLATVLNTYVVLQPLALEVTAKYNLLVEARDAQKQAMQVVKQKETLLEAQRVVMARLLYEDLATLMKKFSADPTQGERFFDLTLLRRPSTDTDSSFEFKGVMEGGITMVVPIPKRITLTTNAPLSFSNLSNLAELHCFFAATASATDSPLKVVVLPGEVVNTTATEIGWGPGNGILIVKNAGTVTVDYEATVSEE